MIRQHVLGVVLAIGLLPSAAGAQLAFHFDYSYDVDGFFDQQSHPDHRDVLEAAAALVNRFIDDLDAIVPSGENTYLVLITDPFTNAMTIIDGPEVAQDTILVYAAGSPNLGETLALGDSPGAVPFGDPEWQETVRYRGETAAQGPSPRNYGPWGGTTSFNTSIDWHFGVEAGGLDEDEFDFFSIAAHELMHVLGYGGADSWQDQISDGQFTGPAATAIGSPNNPTLQLDAVHAHWAAGTESTRAGAGSFDAIMDPFFSPGTRELPTDLDRAALIDIGWEEASEGDADRDRGFDSSDLVQVFVAGKYETGQVATWEQGDWDGSGQFDSNDLIDAFITGTYENGPFSASLPGGTPGDGNISVVYDPGTGEIGVDAGGHEFMAFQIVSEAGVFTGPGPAENLDLAFFDRGYDWKVFKLDPGGFGDLSFGLLAAPGLDAAYLANDLTITGAFVGGGSIEGAVGLFVIPEPGTLVMLLSGGLILLACAWRRRRWR